MKISLIGNGKMGKEVIKLAQERNHELVHIFDIDNKSDFTIENIQKADIIFEFTQPEVAFENISKCLDAGVPCISGTTGWLDKMEIIQERCKNEDKTFFYASNFSIGVNVLFEINKVLAKMMNKYSNYEVSVDETHHIHKLDAPSGTAIQIANQILSNIERKKDWKLDKANSDEILVKAFRENEVPGIHTVKYESEVDFIEIKHSSKNRRGLAFGAVLAAEFVQDKKGFFTMQNLLEL
jgi:4-hydroxy-tetrahydrodipicolinate reductase